MAAETELAKRLGYGDLLPHIDKTNGPEKAALGHEPDADADDNTVRSALRSQCFPQALGVSWTLKFSKSVVTWHVPSTLS